jgi:predicted double-glycine peptidase
MDKSKTMGLSTSQVSIKMYKSIWDTRNKFIYGTSHDDEQKLLRSRIIQQVYVLYFHPPKLAKRFPSVFAIPYRDCIKRTTIYLQRWLSRIKHQ